MGSGEIEFFIKDQVWYSSTNGFLSPSIFIGGQQIHHSDAIMNAMASQITSLMIVYSTVYSDADQRKHQSSMSLAFVRGIHRWQVNYPHKGPVTQKMFPFDEVIMFVIWIMYVWVTNLVWWPNPQSDISRILDKTPGGCWSVLCNRWSNQGRSGGSK